MNLNLLRGSGDPVLNLLEITGNGHIHSGTEHTFATEEPKKPKTL